MPQITLKETQWGSKLVVQLLEQEKIDRTALKSMQTEVVDLLLCPIIVRENGRTELIYQLTGLISLIDLQQTTNISFKSQLDLLIGLCRRLKILSSTLNQSHLMIDQDFIYYRSGDISSNNYLQPIILGLPLQINESSSIESDFIGCLAFITEPVIAQAKTQQVLSDDLIDRLLVSSWESLESLLLAVESARDIVDKDSSQPVPKADDEVEFLLNPDSADRSNRTTSGQTEQYSSPTQASTTRHVRKSKNSKLKIFYLFQSIVLTILLWLYANDYIVSFKEKLIAAGLLTIILILDLIILLHPQSKQKPKETTYQKRSREKSIERTNADRIFKDELKGLYKGGTPSGRQIQPLATLKPLELAYPESDVEYALAIRAFVSVTISHANFCIGADAVVSDLCLKGKEILPIHAEIKYNPEGYMLHSNHGLTNPKKPEFRSELWLNGILLKSNEILPLNDGDEIRFGRYIYSFEMD